MALPTRNTLQSNELVQVNYETKTKQEKEIRERNKYLNARRIAQENLAKCLPGTIQEIFVLDSKVLMAAPRGFFSKTQEIALEITKVIQDNLSRSDKAILIAQLKNDPTNEILKQDAFQAINLEFLKYDAQNTNVDYRGLDRLDKVFVLAMTFNEICGLGPIEPLYRDQTIKEIMCNGPFDVNVEKDGLQKVPACVFKDVDHLQGLITKLYASVNREITRTSPRENARLKDKSRLFATHQAIAPNGPNLNLRRHPEHWISPADLIQWGSASPELMEWLGNHINSGLSFIVNGGTGSGKTTTLSALLGFYPNNKRIVTIEKNMEVKVPHWKMQSASLECIPKKHGSDNYVDMNDLVECCTQMRPDLIVCGEVIGKEAYAMIQAGNTGHQLMTTLHSNSSKECMERVVSLVSQAGLIQGKETLELISAGIDVVVSVQRLDDGSRKIVNVSEVGTQAEVGPNGAYLPIKTIWEFVPNHISRSLGSKITGEWKKVGELSEERRKRHRLDKISFLSLPELMELTVPTED